MSSYLRLRQICLIAHDLEANARALCDTFGLAVCNRDPNVERHGLKNVVIPVGATFLEVVAPFRDNTPGGRHLDRLGGDGGYMVILDCDDLVQRREHFHALGVRIVRFADYSHEGYRALHLHPKDTGGTLLSVDQDDRGGDLLGSWHPGGPDWIHFVRTGRVAAIAGAVLQSDDPVGLAGRWSEILQRPTEMTGNQPGIRLDNAWLRFVRADQGQPETLCGVDLKVVDRDATLEAARRAGFLRPDGGIVICGVRFGLIG